MLAVAALSAQEVAAPKVAISAAYTADIVDEVEFIGRGEAVDKVELVARVSGFIQNVDAADGSTVKQGDVLYRIEPDEYEAAVAAAVASVDRAKAELELASIELNRTRELFERGTTPESQFDLARANEQVAKAQLASAQSALRQAELNLSYTQVTAPFDGRIGRSIASIGELVGPTSGSLVNVVSISPIYVSFSLSEKNLLDIMEAMEREVINNENLDLAPPVFARLPNGIVLEEEGEIVFMDNRVDPATGTISVRAVFQNEREMIFDGSFLNVIIRSPVPRSALLIPQAAVQRDQRGDFVLVVNSEQLVEQRYVELGVNEGAQVTVLDGLVEGESVIVEGLQRVRPGVAVDAVLAARGQE
ncbi:MAG: efflux RND transporter periplasmic adaptor subunit [Rhodobacteraceae bacterium]|nr:efflux RND transporter periplasmic adaptor subunit [Paracoccaceae bacterium]